jgi:hypothetical protein
MQKTTMDLQKLSDCVTKETMVDEIFFRINDIIQFFGSRVQHGYSFCAEESPPLYVYWDNDQMSNDFEVDGFDKDDDD